jgi:purine-binding chemotaxis protein CheW
MTAQAEESRTLQVACFHVGAEEYALDIMRIKEIINPVRITTVPKAPRFIEGIIELRGAILPVVDLRRRFDLPATKPTRESKYVIVSLAGKIVGLIVDRVSEVLRIDSNEVKEAPDMAIGQEARFFLGVYQRDKRIVLVLDIDEVLTSMERSELAELGEVEA